MHNPPADANVCDENKNAQKPATNKDYNRHELHGQGARIANSYIISH
jgi:hypothetical protein